METHGSCWFGHSSLNRPATKRTSVLSISFLHIYDNEAAKHEFDEEIEIAASLSDCSLRSILHSPYFLQGPQVQDREHEAGTDESAQGGLRCPTYKGCFLQIFTVSQVNGFVDDKQKRIFAAGSNGNVYMWGRPIADAWSDAPTRIIPVGHSTSNRFSSGGAKWLDSSPSSPHYGSFNFSATP